MKTDHMYACLTTNAWLMHSALWSPEEIPHTLCFGANFPDMLFWCWLMPSLSHSMCCVDVSGWYPWGISAGRSVTVPSWVFFPISSWVPSCSACSARARLRYWNISHNISGCSFRPWWLKPLLACRLQRAEVWRAVTWGQSEISYPNSIINLILSWLFYSEQITFFNLFIYIQAVWDKYLHWGYNIRYHFKLQNVFPTMLCGKEQVERFFRQSLPPPPRRTHRYS